MQGTLQAEFTSHGKPMVRRLNKDRDYVSVDGQKIALPGRSLMLVRNGGHLISVSRSQVPEQTFLTFLTFRDMATVL